MGAVSFPDIVLNVNYFDIRAQRNGTTWLSNGCATPLGMYYDNISGGSTQPEQETSDYFPGLRHFVDEHNKAAPVDTFFWEMNQPGVPLHIVINTDRFSREATNYANKLTNMRGQFVAFSGTSLIPRRDDGPKGSRIMGQPKRPGLPWVTITSRIVFIFFTAVLTVTALTVGI